MAEEKKEQKLGDDIINILRDDIFDTVNLNQQNIPERQFRRIAQEFIDDINFDDFTSKELTALSDEIINHVANEDLRFILLEELNRVVEVGSARFTAEQISPIITEEQVGLELKIPTEEFAKILNEFEVFEDEVEEEAEKVAGFEFKNVKKNKQRAIKKLNVYENLIGKLRNLLRKENVTFNENDIGIDDVNTFREDLEDDPELAENILIQLTESIIDVDKFIRNTVFKLGQKRKGRPAKIVEPNLGIAKQSIADFIKELRREINQLKEKDEFFAKRIGIEVSKGIGVHQPHKEHDIGKIKIFSDKTTGIKEILIKMDVTGDDLVKLVHSLTRTSGVLVDIDGNEIIEIVGVNKDFNKVFKAIMEFIEKQPKGHSVRLIYKALNKVGEHIVGGAFTHHFFNKNKFKNILFGSNFLPKDLAKNRIVGGSIKSNFLLNPIRFII